MLRAALFLVLLVPAQVWAQTAHHHAMGEAPVEVGQGAFATIQEIVGLLEADPTTDWTKVDIGALRQHLIDMDNVTLRADVTSEPVDGGMRFTVSGAGPVKDSIQRMATAHAIAMDGAGGWRFAASKTDAGVVLTVLVPASDAAKLRGLGFIGVMARGMHHPMHHLMIARGQNPHP